MSRSTFRIPQVIKKRKHSLRLNKRHESGYSNTAVSQIKLAYACTCVHHSNLSNLPKTHVQLSWICTRFPAVTFISLSSLFTKNLRPKSKFKNDRDLDFSPNYHHTENPEFSTPFAAGICCMSFDLNMPKYALIWYCLGEFLWKLFLSLKYIIDGMPLFWRHHLSMVEGFYIAVW